MIEGKKILAVIPARGGSKGLPGKNIRQLDDRPLIAWTIDAAKRSKYIDRIIVSSDDEDIMDIAEEWGCEAPFVRPAHLATDQSIVTETLIHALESDSGKYDFVVLLNPTTPFRSSEDIESCIEKCFSSDAVAAVSVTQQDKSPTWMFHLDDVGHMTPVLPNEDLAERRQNAKDVWVLNGAFYVWQVNWFLEHQELIPKQAVAFEMPKERSVDIDTELDFLLAETMVGKEMPDH